MKYEITVGLCFRVGTARHLLERIATRRAEDAKQQNENNEGIKYGKECYANIKDEH